MEEDIERQACLNAALNQDTTMIECGIDPGVVTIKVENGQVSIDVESGMINIKGHVTYEELHDIVKDCSGPLKIRGCCVGK